MVLDGTNLDKWALTDGDSYVLSVNSGNVVVNGKTDIIANNDGALAYAFDSCNNGYYAAPTVTVETTGTIDGNVEVTGGNLNLNAGTVDGKLVYTAGTVTKADAVQLEAPADYEWVDGVLTAMAYVAEVNGQKFESFDDAITYANTITDGVVNIVLLNNVEFGGDDIDTNVVLDLNGYTITSTGSYFFWLDPGHLTIKDSSDAKTGKLNGVTTNNAFIVYGNSSLVVESGLVESKGNVIYTGADNNTVTIKGGKFVNTSGENHVFYLTGNNSTITVEDGTFIGYVGAWGGNLSITGGLFSQDVGAYCAKNYGAAKNADGMYEIVAITAENAVAQIGDRYFLSLSAAVLAASDTDTIVVLKDITEDLTQSLRGKIVAADGKTITINATNTGDWYYLPYNFEIGENIIFNMPNSSFFVHYGTGVINGKVTVYGLYLRYAGTKLIINAPGSFTTIDREMFIIRDVAGDTEAGIYINGDNNDETVELSVGVIYFYQGVIKAKDATINVSTHYQTQTTDANALANAGSADLILDNTLMNVGYVFKVDGNSNVALNNGSKVVVAQGYDGTSDVTVTIDDTSAFTKNGKSIFAAKIGNVAYLTLADALAAAKDGDTIKLLADHEGTVVLPANVKLDLNGKTIKGNIVGTVAMNNGTWITPDKNYVMAGPEADYYITTDAVLTIDANGNIVVEEGTLKLAQSWWTGIGQTLTIAKDATFVVPAGMNLNVLSTVIVEGTAIVDGTITLYDAAATITVADNTLNVITTVSNAKVVYENGKYIVHVHVWSDATCTEPKTCECGDTLGQALGHDEKTVAGKDATCTETGLTDGVVCDRCGVTLKAQEEIPALGHDKKTVAGKDATCTETGLTDGVVCDRCGVTLKAQEEIPAKGHKYEAVVTAPGELTAGFTTYTCVCGDSYEANFVMPNCNEVQNVVATVIDGTMNLKVTWDALDRADLYLVYVYDANGNQVRGASVTRTYAQINGFAAGEYTVMVRARVGSKYTGIYEPVAVTFGTSAPVAEIVEVNKDSIKVQWNAVANADWYFVEIIGGGKRLVPGTSETSIVIDNLLPGTEYTVSICARYIENGVYKYTEYGVADKETTRGGASTDATAVVGGIKVTWTTDPAGDMYWLYRVDANGNTIKLLAATTETSALVDYIEGQNGFKVISRVMIDGKYKYIESDIFEYTGAPAVEVGFETAVAVEGDNGTTISWKSVPDGDMYWVYRVVNGEKKLIAATTSTIITVDTTEDNRFKIIARVIVDGKYRYINSDEFVAETHVSNAEDLKDALENIPEGGSGNIVLDGDINLDDLSGLLG